MNRRSLGNHLVRSHVELGGQVGYVLKHFLNGTVPKCKCGCGEDVKWHRTQYRFNDYLNGHNDAGYTSPNFKPTTEQVAYRVGCIKQSYKENGEEFSAKIGVAVAEAFKDPTKKQNLIEGQRKSWDSEERREQASASQKLAWSGDAGEARRAKVFTPEFGDKIGAANMQRDAKRVSKEELSFVDHLRSVFGDSGVVASKWFNFTEKKWCADAWLVDHGAIVEYDGVYDHGLDRTGDFTHRQVCNLANDFTKHCIAIDKQLTLIRVASNSLWHGVKRFSDLIDVAYHVIIDGAVAKDGSFKLASDDVPIVSREALIRQRQKHACADAWIENELLPAIAELLRKHVQHHGWFYPPVPGTLGDALLELCEVDPRPMAGSQWLKASCRSFWDVDGGPVVAFNDDKRLRSVLAYRLGLNNSKPYTYVLSTGERVTCNETFDISLKNVRRGFIVQRNSVSWFKPSVAARVYREFLGGTTKPVVWDPSVGFSARLLAFASVFPGGTYVGTDPATPMIADARRLSVALGDRCAVELHVAGSEVDMGWRDRFDLVFTSVPYFDREQYFDEPGQCWRDFPTLDAWIHGYLVPTMANALRSLKPGGHCVINVEQGLATVVENAATSVGFTRTADRDTHLRLRRDHFAKKVGITDDREEPFLAFTKPHT